MAKKDLKWSNIFKMYFKCTQSFQAAPDTHSRQKRDATCAAGGHKACNLSCKVRGWAEGSCAWNTETGAFNCECDNVKRGVR